MELVTKNLNKPLNEHEIFQKISKIISYFVVIICTLLQADVSNGAR